MNFDGTTVSIEYRESNVADAMIPGTCHGTLSDGRGSAGTAIAGASAHRGSRRAALIRPDTAGHAEPGLRHGRRPGSHIGENARIRGSQADSGRAGIPGCQPARQGPPATATIGGLEEVGERGAGRRLACSWDALAGLAPASVRLPTLQAFHKHEPTVRRLI